ncbi:MAG: hypothetical protein ABJ246_19965 [Paracoccaceae bacterium]
MHPARKFPWFILCWIAVFFCLGLAIWYGAMRYIESSPPQDHGLVEKLGVAGLALAFGGVLGGVLAGLVKLLFERWDDQKKQKEANQAFYRNILDDLKSVYDTVERSRLLVAAHRSAKTYGEQMRSLPDAVVTIHNIKRALKPGFSDLDQQLEAPLNCCSGFLKGLIFEFRDNYVEVSFEQSKYEAQKKAQLEKQAKAPDTPIKITSQSPAWNVISKLPELSVLCSDDRFEEYDVRFVCHIDAASHSLRNLLDDGTDSNPDSVTKNRSKLSQQYHEYWSQLIAIDSASKRDIGHLAAMKTIDWLADQK